MLIDLLFDSMLVFNLTSCARIEGDHSPVQGNCENMAVDLRQPNLYSIEKGQFQRLSKKTNWHINSIY